MNQNDRLSYDKASSYTDWWAMAGVDYLTGEDTVNWLEQPDKVKTPQVNKIMQAQSPTSESAPTHADRPQLITTDNWPKSLGEIVQNLKNKTPLPGSEYGGNIALPCGPENPALMVISDVPDIEEANSGQLGQSAAGRLLANMVKAIGHNLDDCYLTALATTRPASGDLPQDVQKDLVPFMMHQIHIANPKFVLILGSAACSALLNAELMTARGNLHYFNHNVQKVTAITTFHPRTLIARPILKAQAWKDLQMILKHKDLL